MVILVSCHRSRIRARRWRLHHAPGPASGRGGGASTTRAMRRLRPDPVPEELLNRLIQGARPAFGPVGHKPVRSVAHRDGR
ncbi:hypothetical protein GCM10014713_24360 [Streptomyces purpureus]|uniref:Uncharacterized protein n=1 Tax=Streptomyces purpureus TaxID=1951 RepID=A0A918H2P1_9ACTN|nr:hypothetical protein GCM10014713_24360 [Streptomyces purpureus]